MEEETKKAKKNKSRHFVHRVVTGPGSQLINKKPKLYVFSNEWHPLIGALPSILEIPGSSEVSLFNIIVEARAQMRIDTYIGCSEDFWRPQLLPGIEGRRHKRITGESCEESFTLADSRKFNSARTIFECSGSVIDHIAKRARFWDKDSDHINTGYSIFENEDEQKMAIDLVRDLRHGQLDVETEDYEILMILAISMAHWGLEDESITGYDDRDKSDCVLGAKALLLRAVELKDHARTIFTRSDRQLWITLANIITEMRNTSDCDYENTADELMKALLAKGHSKIDNLIVKKDCKIIKNKIIKDFKNFIFPDIARRKTVVKKWTVFELASGITVFLGCCHINHGKDMTYTVKNHLEENRHLITL